MDYAYLRKVVISQCFVVLTKPNLFFELFQNKNNDFWVNHKTKDWFIRNSKNKRVFEYGSGYSTDFLAGICKEIVSVESNPKWFSESNKTKRKNKKVILQQKKNSYVNEIEKHGEFDIVFVDGEHRKDCAKKAWNSLKKGGVLVLDDANSKAHAKDIFDSFNAPKFLLGGLKSNTGGYWETGFVLKK
jgi:hypothetical protein